MTVASPPGVINQAPFEKILVLVDFDETSQRSLVLAGRLAGPNPSGVHVAHVVPPLANAIAGLGITGPDLATAAAAAEVATSGVEATEHRLERWVSQCLPSLEGIETSVHTGPVDDAVAQLSAAYDLLIVGMTSRSWLDRWFGRPAAEDATSLASCPVLLVPASAGATTEA